MMDWSDKHCRYLWRLITKRSLLYTEMVTTGALIHGDQQRFLDYNAEEHPLALQLGGSDPAALAECARMAEDWGYDEVNLNCGCPSDRVQSGKIGAILMAEPELVARCVEAMRQSCNIPVTVKHRIGIDAQEDYADLHRFVTCVADAGCDTFIVHARKAWLKGLSPKENREVPPLRYELVYQLKQALPALNIVINGGIKDSDKCLEMLDHVDGVMIGREAYQNPYFLNEVDSKIFGEAPSSKTRMDIAHAFLPYCQQQLDKGTRLHHLTRHMLGLFHGQPRARLFRQHISMNANQADADITVLEEALALLNFTAS